ncbi:FecCD family ABC transporter permease [Microbacterium allomyrinae]|jgi:ABC-type enterobactin transport system permease subunit|uniref:Iron chelate uptake ABC transporter family permease subunit n=1 Tax=Microbacterium allomyrinae TaxID=2830666 RepID=A0A9X1S1C0_9MICO|nr:iron chelate uptake ABC transporter family permease subunit [Microbacterium allomyrinae]MCC2031526.1 iron chelate uptake ABC transporter family permease subunit [Microbacterium allomyrinae]
MTTGTVRVWRSRNERIALRWHRRPVATAGVLILLLVPLGILALLTGSFDITPADLWGALTGQGEPSVARVLGSIRMPRYVGGIVVGAALGVSGAVFQTISRNPLGSPDIIGFVTGAATGAVVAILVFDAPPGIVSLAAVCSGMLTAVVVGALSLRGGTAGGYRLVLVGIGVGALLGAVNDLLLTRSQRDDAIVAQIWLVGTLNGRGWPEVLPTVIAVVILIPALLLMRRGLAALELGDGMARQVGAPVTVVRLATIAMAVGLAAFATATAGPIAFVALAAPQLVARVGRAASVPLVGSAAMGAALLVSADLLSQHLPLSLMAPVGLVTGVLGGVYLLWLLSRGR